MMMRLRRALLMQGLCFAALVAGAPTAGAQVSDVPYVPTPRNVVDAMLGLAQVGPNDYVIDLGSGDGRIVIAAAKKHGARGFGVDIDGALVDEARREARRQGVSDRVSFFNRNLFITDISKATVVTMYLFPQVNMRLRPRLLKELKPGTRIVSHEFDLEEWQPDQKLTVPVPDKPYGAPSSDVFLWIVPADASGTWRWRPAGAAYEDEVTLRQQFQMLEGEGRSAGQPVRVSAGRVRGEEVRFTLVTQDGRRAHDYTARIGGEAMRGTVVARSTAAQREWHAVRATRGAAVQQTTIAEEQ